MRNVLFTFLGRGDYKSCVYTYEGKTASRTRFIQTAIYELMAKEDPPLEIVLFTTPEAKNQNWKTRQDKEGNILEGIEQSLERLVPDAKVKLVDISGAQDETANWGLFDVLIQEIKEDDQIYFDMTHSFRSIPLISLIVLNYARRFKKAKLKKLVYGLFDSDNPDKEAPIVDMSEMTDLLDWTNGVDQYMRTGHATLIEELTTFKTKQVFQDDSIQPDEKKNASSFSKLARQMEKVSKAFQTCRSLEITNEIKKLNDNIEVVKHMDRVQVKPLVPLLDAIEKKYEAFGDNELMNGQLAAQWCHDHDLIQPGVTLLQENTVTAICRAFKQDFSDRRVRSDINSAMKIIVNELPQCKWRVHDKTFTKKMVGYLSSYKDYLESYAKLSDDRNDINHAGTKKSAMKPDKMKRNLQKSITDLRPFIQKLAEMESVRS